MKLLKLAETTGQIMVGTLMGLLMLAIYLFMAGAAIIIPVGFCLLVVRWIGRLFS